MCIERTGSCLVQNSHKGKDFVSQLSALLTHLLVTSSVLPFSMKKFSYTLDRIKHQPTWTPRGYPEN